MKRFDFVGRVISDLVGLFLLPILVAVLPWRAGLCVLKLAAQRMRTFRIESDAAWQVASRYVSTGDVEAWKARYRLIRWVERADTYLTLTRSARWWRQHIDVTGSWPQGPEACLLLTYHWGAGNWIWKLLRRRGITAYFLARRPVARDLGASRIALGYAALRVWALRRMGSLGPLYTGGSIDRIRMAWQGGNGVVAMVDLPASPSQSRQRVMLLGQPAELSPRLAELASSAGVRPVVFSCGFDHESGRRQLSIEVLPMSSSAAALVDLYAHHLDDCLRKAPELWMMWHEAKAILVE